MHLLLGRALSLSLACTRGRHGSPGGLIVPLFLFLCVFSGREDGREPHGRVDLDVVQQAQEHRQGRRTQP